VQLRPDAQEESAGRPIRTGIIRHAIMVSYRSPRGQSAGCGALLDGRITRMEWSLPDDGIGPIAGSTWFTRGFATSQVAAR
jgi:hypothetical protein